MTSKSDASKSFSRRVADPAPGVLAAAFVALVASLAAPLLAPIVPVPAMVLALVFGIAGNRVAAGGRFREGLTFSVKRILRWAVALLGLRIALGDIVGLGLDTALLVVASMIVTILAGFGIARALGQTAMYGALAGTATAVCGASATLATASVLPAYEGKEADIAFVVVAVNALSTLAMLVYPPIALVAGFDATTTGVLLGATIHDVAQVVGAGYAVSEETGNSAVVVKLFRVFLLLPVVLAIGWWFARRASGTAAERAKVPAPAFAYVFLALVVLNSVMPMAPALAPVWEPLRAVLVFASTAGLLVAIGALGLTTSLTALASVGWRHVATVSATTLLLLFLVTGALVAL